MTRKGRKRLEEKHPEILEQLGTMPDADLAALYGVHRNTIISCRRRNNTQKPGSGLMGEARARPWLTHEQLIEADPSPEGGKVVVAFSIAESGTVSLLHSHGGVRVYDKDHVDPRVTMGRPPLPHFRTWCEAEAYLKEETGKHRPCLLDYEAAQHTFNEEWADFTQEQTPPVEQKIREAAKAGKGVRLSAEEVTWLAECQ